MRLRYKVLSVGIVLVGVFLYGRCGRKAGNIPTVLPANDREQIIVDPVKHRLTIVKPEGVDVLTLPDRASVIDIHKNNSVTITSAQAGFEHKPFIGLFVSNAFRIGAGIDLGYWKRLDFGVGAACEVGSHTPVVMAKGSYVVWDNVQLGLTYDNEQHVGVGLSVRL